MRVAGYDTDRVSSAACRFRDVVESEFNDWLHTLPPLLRRERLVKHRRALWDHGIVLVRLDRNPGGVVAMCVEAWNAINAEVFF